MRTIDVSGFASMRKHFRRCAYATGYQAVLLVMGYFGDAALHDLGYLGGGLLAAATCAALAMGRFSAARVLAPALVVWNIVLTTRLAPGKIAGMDENIQFWFAAVFILLALYAAGVCLMPSVRAAGRSPYLPIAYATDTSLASAYGSGTLAWKDRLRQLRPWPVFVAVATFTVGLIAMFLARTFLGRGADKTARNAVFGAGGAAFVWAKRRFALRGTEVREIDNRPPVLLLRSFGDDMMVIRGATRWSSDTDLARKGMTFERVVSKQLSTFGPFVGIGRPEEPLAPLGAARDYVPDAVWQEEVRRRMQDAAVVVLIIGTSEGLAWELARLHDLGHLHKVILLFPPADDLEVRWLTLLTRDQLTGAPVLPEAVRPEKTLALIYADDLTPIAIEGKRDEWSYETAIRIAGMLAVTTGAEPAAA